MSLLFLAHRAPFAPDRGDRIRSYHVLRHLAARMPVHLVTFADRDEPVPDLGLASCTVLPLRKSRVRALGEALATGRPVSLTAFGDAAFTRAVADVVAAHAPAAAYVFSGQMAQHVPAGMRFAMDFVDVDSAKFAGLAAGVTAPLYWREARLLGRYERAVAERAAASLFVSAAEAALFGDAPRVRVVENGIDTGHFAPGIVPAETGGAEIVFTGQMDYAPNIDAVRWFVAEVFPLVRQVQPGTRFAIVGRAPTAAVRSLAGEGVTVTGEVADVRGWLAAARVAVAPLRIARGVQNKVLEAMAMALPVVATGAAAEGIDHGGAIRVADDAASFAAAVVGMLDDDGGSGAGGRAQAIRRYGWDAALAPLDDLLPRHAGLVPASTSPRTFGDSDPRHGGCRDQPGMTGEAA